MTNWTGEKLERAKRLWDDGRSAGEIAKEIGLTRNQVCGVAHRRHWSQGGVRMSKPRAPKPPRPARTPSDGKRFANVVRSVNTPPKFKASPVKAAPPVPPTARMLPLMALTSTTCKFPIGEPGREGFGFCGADKPGEPDIPYCRFHTRLCHQSVAEARAQTIARLAGGKALGR